MAYLFVLEPDDFNRWRKSPGRDGFPVPLDVVSLGGADLHYNLLRSGISCVSCLHPEWVAMQVPVGSRGAWVESLCRDFNIAVPA